jgi:hypothetical protein
MAGLLIGTARANTLTGTLSNAVQDNITRLGTVASGVIGSGVTGGSGLDALSGAGKILGIYEVDTTWSGSKTANFVAGTQQITITSGSKVLLIYQAQHIEQNSTGYFVAYLNGGGLGATGSTNGRELGLTHYGGSNRFHYGGIALDTAPGSTTPTYEVYYGGASGPSLISYPGNRLILMEIGA